MKCLAIVTARGGSKRIPGKNIRDFLGKPILSYPIKCAIESGAFDEVMVSTDSEEIAEIAKKYGARVPFMRSKETANDYATTEDVIMEVLKCYEAEDVHFDYVVCLYPTAPFVRAEWIKNGLEVMQKTQANMLMTVVKYSFPPQRGMIKDGEYIKYKWPQYMLSRSQDLENIYHDVGQFYCYNVKAFMKLNGLIEDKIVPFEVEEAEVQDIDTYEDWKIAELKYRILWGQEGNE